MKIGTNSIVIFITHNSACADRQSYTVAQAQCQNYVNPSLHSNESKLLFAYWVNAF